MQLVNFVLRDIIRKLEEGVHAASSSQSDTEIQPNSLLSASQSTEISNQLFGLLQNDGAVSEVYSSVQKYAETALGEVLYILWARNLFEEGRSQNGKHTELEEYMFLHSVFGMLSSQHGWSQGTGSCTSDLFRRVSRNFHIAFEGKVPYFAEIHANHQHRKPFYSIFPCFQQSDRELQTKEFVLINDEISYFYQLEKRLECGDLYGVDKLRIIGSQLSGSKMQAADYLLFGSAERMKRQPDHSDEQSQILETTRVIVANVMRRCALETWQASQLCQLSASLKAHSLPLGMLHDPLLLLIVMHHAFSAWETGKRDSLEISFLRDIISDMTADGKGAEVFLYGLFYWFYTFDREKLHTNRTLMAGQGDIAALHPMDRAAQVIFLSSPFIACCRTHHRLFSYLNSVLEDWGDECLEEDTDTERSYPSPSLKVIMRLKLHVLQIARLAQNPCLQSDVVRFFTQAIRHGIQCLKKSPSLHASLTVYLAFSALLGLIVHSKPQGGHDVAIEHVRLIDAVVTLCGMQSIAKEFPFLRPPSSSIAMWLYEMCVYIRLLHGSPHARSVFQQWFDAFGDALQL